MNIDLLKLTIDKSTSRADILIHLDLTKSPCTLQLLQIFINEYFYNLELVSAITKSENTPAVNELIEITLTKSKTLFHHICTHTRILVKKLDCAESLNQLGLIINELYSNFSGNVSLDQTKFYAFLYSVDIRIFEICEFLIEPNETKIGILPDKDLISCNLNDCLKNIVTEGNIQVFEVEKSMGIFERIKLVALAFSSEMSVCCIQLGKLFKCFLVNFSATFIHFLFL